MNRGRVEQVDGARGGLRAPGDDLRRRLHRRLQPDAGRRSTRRAAAAPRSSSTPGVEIEAPSQRARDRRALPRGRPPGEAARSTDGDGRRRSRRPAERRGHRRELGLPRHLDPDRRRARRRRADDRARARTPTRPSGSGCPAAARGSRSAGRRSTSTWSASRPRSGSTRGRSEAAEASNDTRGEPMTRREARGCDRGGDRRGGRAGARRSRACGGDGGGRAAANEAET